MVEPILYESHMHTPLCKHAVGDPEAYAQQAEKQGLKGIIVTCHNPPINNWTPHVRMAADQFNKYVALVHRTTTKWEGRVDVRLGMECDYLPGMEEALIKQLKQAEFHHILGSVHPQFREYRKRYAPDDLDRLQEVYFEHLAMAAESGLFDTMAHPDLVKNEVPESWNPEAIAPLIRASLDRVAATGVAMELNTSGLNKRLPEMNPGTWMLAEMQARNIPVVIGADAHRPDRVADQYPEALRLLQAAGYRQVSFFLNRQRQDVSIDLALASLQRDVVTV